MKRIYIIAFSLILIFFILITYQKIKPSQKIIQKEDQSLLAEKEKVQAFWKIYRQANEQRINGQLNKAVKGFKNALGYDDKHEDTHYYLGNVYFDLDKYDKAETYWKKLIKINPESARAYFQLGNFYLNLVDEKYFDFN